MYAKNRIRKQKTADAAASAVQQFYFIYEILIFLNFVVKRKPGLLLIVVKNIFFKTRITSNSQKVAEAKQTLLQIIHLTVSPNAYVFASDPRSRPDVAEELLLPRFSPRQEPPKHNPNAQDKERQSDAQGQ